MTTKDKLIKIGMWTFIFVHAEIISAGNSLIVDDYPFGTPYASIGAVILPILFSMYEDKKGIISLWVVALGLFFTCVMFQYFQFLDSCYDFLIISTLTSWLVMMFLKRTNLFSAVGISVAGNFFYVLAEIFLAAKIYHSPEILNYFWDVEIGAIIMGIIIGIVIKRAIVLEIVGRD